MASGRLLFIVNDTTFFVSHRLPIAIAARAAGFEIHLAAFDLGGLEQVRAHGIAFHPLAVDRTGINPLRDVFLFCQLLALIRSLRPTLIHTVTIKPVIYGGIAARLLRVPSLVSAVSGLGSVFVDADKKAALVRSIVRGLYGLALAHRNSCAIFQNPEDRDQMVNAKLAALERTVLIRGSGVDTTMFHPAPSRPGCRWRSCRRACSGTRASREFVEATRLCVSSGSRSGWPWSASRRRSNRASVPEAKIRAWVEQGIIEWWGYRSDMPQAYADCHIVCLPSFYGEGVPGR